MMYDNFIQFINEKRLLESHQKVLLAVSGGVDSMVLLHLFEQSDFKYGIVHCNFQLRGEESDADEDFVKKQVLIHGVPSYFRKFDTEDYARISGISIEMAARELRYKYFEEIRKKNHFDFIATAHHQDDLIETFFLNLSRKTGIKGLTGIKEKSGKIIRPLLFTNREEIEKYAAQHYIEYREDSSNNEIVYQRNFLRNKILPLFEALNPAFKKNLLASIDNLKEAGQLYFHFLDAGKNRVLNSSNDETEIDIEKLMAFSFPKVLLFEILSGYNFKPVVIDEVYNSVGTESGKQFFSKTHWLIKDREKFFITEKKDDEEKIYYIEEDDIELFTPFDISIEKTDTKDFEIVKSENVACVDAEKVRFPLLIRKWKQGDYFQPLGMSGFKKISDFLIDQKIPLHEKENTWLLCSGKQIIWIMGHRLDNRFKILPETQKVLKIKIRK